MTKKQFYEMYIKDWIDPKDKPANRMLWSGGLDAAYHDTRITQRQVNSWIYPQTKLFI